MGLIVKNGLGGGYCRLLTSIMLVVGCALLLGAAPRRPGTVPLTVAGTCPQVGDCLLVATWTLPASWNTTTDSVRVQWKVGTTVTTHYPLRTATADSFAVGRADGSAKSGTGQGCVFRKGVTSATGACSSAKPWSVPATAPDSLPDFRVTPASVSLVPTQRQLFVVSN